MHVFKVQWNQKNSGQTFSDVVCYTAIADKVAQNLKIIIDGTNYNKTLSTNQKSAYGIYG